MEQESTLYIWDEYDVFGDSVYSQNVKDRIMLKWNHQQRNMIDFEILEKSLIVIDFLICLNFRLLLD